MEIVVNRIIWYSPPHASNLLFMNILWKQESLNPNKIVVVFQMPIVVSVAAAMGSDWRSFIRKFHWVGQQRQQWWRAVRSRLEEKLEVQAATLYQGVGVTFLGKRSPWKWKRREGRTVTTTKPIHHGKKIFSPFHIARIAGKTCDGGFYLLCFPGNGVKNEAHFMVRPHLTVLLCNKKIDNRSVFLLKWNVMTPTQRNFLLLWSKY